MARFPLPKPTASRDLKHELSAPCRHRGSHLDAAARHRIRPDHACRGAAGPTERTPLKLELRKSDPIIAEGKGHSRSVLLSIPHKDARSTLYLWAIPDGDLREIDLFIELRDANTNELLLTPDNVKGTKLPSIDWHYTTNRQLKATIAAKDVHHTVPFTIEYRIGHDTKATLDLAKRISTFADSVNPDAIRSDRTKVRAVFNKTRALLDEALAALATAPRPALIAPLNALAHPLYLLSNAALSCEAFTRCAQVANTVHPSGHPEILTAEGNLAAIYSELERHDEALNLLQQILRGRKALHPTGHPEILTAQGNLAIIYSALGDYEKALELEEQVLNGFKALHPPGHPLILKTQQNLSAIYSRLERYDEALELRGRVLKGLQALHPPEHPNILDAQQNLAGTHTVLGRLEDAANAALRHLRGAKRASHVVPPSLKR